MKIIVGLGNPGTEYQHSRHNAGFMALDLLAQKLGCSFKDEKDFFAQIAKTSECVLIKPQTFMNESGRTVRAWMQYFKLIATDAQYPDLTVVYDDLDIALGSWKYQFGTGPKVHNGVTSVISHLGSDQFWHARIGTENRQQHRLSIPSHEYVLTPFSADEFKLIDQVLAQLSKQLLGQ